MAETWTMTELVEEVTRRIQALPRPQNGQVRAVPDDRTVRYYLTIGLLDRPAAMRGRTALYERKHVAQVVAIKRLQSMGRSLAEIQALWPTLDDATLARMSGVELAPMRKARKDFWRRAPAPAPAFDVPAPPVEPTTPTPPPPRPPVWSGPDGAGGAGSHGAGAPAELRIELAPNLSISIALSSDIAVSLADVAAIRAAAAPLIAELASRQLGMHAEESEQGADV